MTRLLGSESGHQAIQLIQDRMAFAELQAKLKEEIKELLEDGAEELMRDEWQNEFTFTYSLSKEEAEKFVIFAKKLLHRVNHQVKCNASRYEFDYTVEADKVWVGLSLREGDLSWAIDVVSDE